MLKQAGFSAYCAKNLVFSLECKKPVQSVINKIESKSKKLSEFCSIDRGCDTADNKRYTGSKFIKDKNAKRLLSGRDISRYYNAWNNLYLYYLPEQMIKNKATARPGDSERFEVKEKLIVYRFLDNKGRFVATYDSEQFYCFGSTYVVSLLPNSQISLKFVLAILNSNLVAFHNKRFEGVKITLNEMKSLPIYNLDNSDKKEVIQHNQIVSLVDQVTDLYHELNSKRTPYDKNRIKREIITNEINLNKIIYELYGLTEDFEIKLVEDALK